MSTPVQDMLFGCILHFFQLHCGRMHTFRWVQTVFANPVSSEDKHTFQLNKYLGYKMLTFFFKQEICFLWQSTNDQ